MKKLLSAFAILLCIGTIATIPMPQTPCIPIVSAAASKSKKVALNKTKLTLYTGKSYTLKLKNNKKKVKWSSSKTNIATVSSKGKVKAKKAGKTTITAKVGKKKYKCKVTVKVNYGSIKGTVTYYYLGKDYRYGDSKATVVVVNTDGSAKKVKFKNPFYIQDNTAYLNKNGVYIASCDGYGNYELSKVPVGKYRIFIVSRKVSSYKLSPFDSYKDYDPSKMVEENRQNAISSMTKYTNTKAGNIFGESIKYYEFVYGDNKLVTKNNTLNFSFDFLTY